MGPLLLGQGEKVLASLSGQEEKNSGSSVTGGKRKPRDFVPSGNNVNKHRHADTFKPSPAKASDDSFKPVVQTPKSEKIILKNTILASPELIPSPKDTELIPESSIRPTTSPPSPSSSTTSPLTTPTSAELLASADPELLGALGHASPEILAALQVIAGRSTCCSPINRGPF